MPDAIENYTPQVVVKTLEKSAKAAWALSFCLALIWVFLILLAPVAEAHNFSGISHPIYNFFGYLCHQIPSRSFYIENHTFAVCARCFGFYFGLLLGFIIYPFSRSLNNTDSFPRFWLFLAMIPMGVDWSLTFFGIWENTHFSRLITGGILGAACAFFIIPALVEISFYLSGKFQNRI